MLDRAAAYRSLFALCGLTVLLVMPRSLSGQCDPLAGGEAPLVPPPPCPIASVLPDGLAANRAVNSMGNSQTFWVQNVGGAAGSFSLFCWGTNGITCTGTNPSTVSLGAGEQRQVTANYNVGAPGSGELWLRASGETSDTGYWVITVGAPVVDTTPYNWAKQDYARCAQACFAATHVQGTVPYFSLDAPRNVVLMYNGDRLNPKPFVHVNVSPDPGDTTLTEYRLQVKVNGAFVTFVNGEQTLRFAKQTNAPVRIGGQWSSTLATGLYDMDIHVSGLYGQLLRTNVITTKFIQVTETASPIATGWTLAGIQRLISVPYGAIIIEGDGSVVHFQDAGGGTYTSPPGEFSKLTGNTRAYPDSTKVIFFAGRMIEVRDRFNNVNTIVYDASNRVWQVKDPLNLAITLSYDANGLTSIQDPGGRVTDIVVDASRRLTTITDPDVLSTTFGYDATHRLTSVTNRRGHATTLVYDSQSGKLATITSPSITYVGTNGADSTGSPVTTLHAWQKVGVPYTSTAGTPATPPRADTVRARLINSRGFTTVFQVDRFGAITRLEEPLGRTTKLARDSHSRVTVDTAPSGHVTEYTWTGINLTKTYDRTTGRTINIDYEPTYNDVLKVYGDIDTVVNVWSGGKLQSTRRANRPAASFTYDSRGRVKTRMDPGNHVTEFYYAPAGWQNIDSVKAGPRRTAFTYDAWGRVATVKDPAGNITTHFYDGLNRDTLVIGPLADSTFFRYDSLFLRSVRDAVGNLHQFARNALGWAETRTDPAGVQDRYAYDKNGNLKEWTNRRGQVVAIGYDDLDRLMSRTADGQTTSFSFNAADTLIAASNTESTDTVKFDAAGRAVAQISVRAGTRYELRSTYNVRDLQTALWITSPWPDTISYIYNANMLLDTLVDLAGGRTKITYDNELLPGAYALPNGLTINGIYPSTHRPAEVRFSEGAIAAAIGAKYTHNDRGLVGDRHRVDQSNTTTGNGRDFGYDPLRRLVRYGDFDIVEVPPSNCDVYDPWHGYVCATPGGQTKSYSYQESYTYDKVGNRTDLGAHTVAGNRLDTFNGDSLFYGADGNLVKRRRAGADIQRLHWNSLGHLIAVWTSGTDSVEFGYDGFGRRVRKWKATGTARYIWADVDDLFAEVDGAGNRIAEYVYYPGVDRPHSVRRGTSTYYYAQDFPGNVIGLVDAGRTLVNEYRYKPFGQTEVAQEGVANALRFAGREFDSETGLYYVRARYYDPQLGRFVSEDPLGLAGGLNAFIYAGNDPVNRVDPSGLVPPLAIAAGAALCTEACVAAVAVVGAATMVYLQQHGQEVAAFAAAGWRTMLNVVARLLWFSNTGSPGSRDPKRPGDDPPPFPPPPADFRDPPAPPPFPPGIRWGPPSGSSVTPGGWSRFYPGGWGRGLWGTPGGGIITIEFGGGGSGTAGGLTVCKYNPSEADTCL